MHNFSSPHLVGIIILHWKSPTDTCQCIYSVLKLKNAAYKIIIVSNNPDDDCQWLQPFRSKVHLIQTGRNLGYAGGNNVGITFALELGCTYVWLLNDDVIVSPNSLATLLDIATKNQDAGFLGPKVCVQENPSQILSAGGLLDASGYAKQRGMGEIDRGDYEVIEQVDWLSGCALLVSRAAITKVGLLDENFFVYYEDVEWCFRGSQANFQVIYVPSAKVTHPDTRERSINSPLITYYITRNRLLFAKKHRLGVQKITNMFLGGLRTLLSWSLQPKWQHKRKHRDALAKALADFALGAYGAKQ